jgi:hypothetical protein
VHGVRPFRGERRGQRFDFIEPAGVTEIRLFREGLELLVHFAIVAQAARPEHAD